MSIEQRIKVEEEAIGELILMQVFAYLVIIFAL